MGEDNDGLIEVPSEQWEEDRMVTDTERRRVVRYDGDRPVSVGDLIDMSCEGARTYELCPECGEEAEIPLTGGMCPECGKWLHPCSMCDPGIIDCDWGHERCPFHCIEIEVGIK